MLINKGGRCKNVSVRTRVPICPFSLQCDEDLEGVVDLASCICALRFLLELIVSVSYAGQLDCSGRRIAAM